MPPNKKAELTRRLFADLDLKPERVTLDHLIQRDLPRPKVTLDMLPSYFGRMEHFI